MSKTEDKRNVPMDDSIKEARVGTAAVNAPRQCWAMKTLIKEVQDLFPETSYEVSNIDGRNTALDVTFDLSMLEETDKKNISALFLMLLLTDERIDSVTTEDGMVLISFRSNPRTQDNRDSFDLSGAYAVLIEDEEPIDHDETFSWAHDDDEGSM